MHMSSSRDLLGKFLGQFFNLNELPPRMAVHCDSLDEDDEKEEEEEDGEEPAQKIPQVGK